MTFSNHGRVVLLLPYTTQFFFSTAFPGLGGNCPQRKIFYPYFLGNDYFFLTFFAIVCVLTQATYDPGLRVPRFAVWGWGQKQIFEMGEKWFLYHFKKSGNFSFPYTLANARGSYPLQNISVFGNIGQPVYEKIGF